MRASVAGLSDDWPRASLPRHLALSEPQRADAERHCAVLAKALTPGPVDRIGASIAGLMLAFPGGKLGDEETAVRARMFREALGDLPAWTVERASQFWLRREHPEGNENYAFAPSAPQLRRLALVALQKVAAEHRQLARLLAAEVEPELTDEQRAANLARLRSIVLGTEDAA